MLDLTAYTEARSLICAALGVSLPFLRLNVAIAAWLGSSLILDRSSASSTPWLIALGVVCADLALSALAPGSSPAGSAASLISTMLWPTMLMLSARLKRRRALTKAAWAKAVLESDQARMPRAPSPWRWDAASTLS